MNESKCSIQRAHSMRCCCFDFVYRAHHFNSIYSFLSRFTSSLFQYSSIYRQENCYWLGSIFLFRPFAHSFVISSFRILLFLNHIYLFILLMIRKRIKTQNEIRVRRHSKSFTRWVCHVRLYVCVYCLFLKLSPERNDR